MERLRKSDEFGTYYIATQPNHDYEAKNGHKKPEVLGQLKLNSNSEKPKGDYTINKD